MRILKQKPDFFELSYPLEKAAPLDKILFLDIETTGFTAKNSNLYMIGGAYFKEGSWHIIQWFANERNEEEKLLKAFFEFAQNFTHLIHFNGNNFDLPYLSEKALMYKLPYSFEHFTGIDIYKRIAAYKSLLNLANCKQKTIEAYLDIQRKDICSGGELISVYHDYLKNPTDIAMQALLQHNADDMLGMLRIVPMLAYSDIFTEGVRVKKAQANYYSDFNGMKQQELLLKLRLPAPLPKPVSRFQNQCYFSAEKEEGYLRIPIYEEEMKYFYSNYKDYYYLPEEDAALHKSVASFVDKKYRQKASASNCYTRKHAAYLPQWEVLFEPFFKRDYESRELFFELTEELKSERSDFTKYAAHVLQMMMHTKKL